MKNLGTLKIKNVMPINVKRLAGILTCTCDLRLNLLFINPCYSILFAVRNRCEHYLQESKTGFS